MITARGLYPEERDMDLSAYIRNNAHQKVLGDEESRDRLVYVREEFATLLPSDYRYADILNTAFSHIVPGLAALESRYDNRLIPSSAGAIGIFQLMPSMIAQRSVNPHEYGVDEVQLSLIKQCELAQNLFRENIYHLLGKNTDKELLGLISHGYF